MAKEKMSQAAAMREALSQGIDDNQQLIAFVKEHAGKELEGKEVSILKSQQKKRLAGATAPAAARTTVNEPPMTASSLVEQHDNTIVSVTLALKSLVDKHGKGAITAVLSLIPDKD